MRKRCWQPRSWCPRACWTSRGTTKSFSLRWQSSSTEIWHKCSNGHRDGRAGWQGSRSENNEHRPASRQRIMNIALQAVYKVTGKGNWGGSGKGPSLRLRTSSSNWNLPGSTGHTASFSSSLSRTSRWLSRRQWSSSPLFLWRRSRRLRWLVCTFRQGELDQAVVSLPMLETCGDTVARKALTGTATFCVVDWKRRHFFHRSSANTTWTALPCMLSGWIGLAKRCPLLQENCEFARVVLSCHVAMDMLCQEMHGW